MLLTLPRWNWGAFCLTWIWALGHGLYAVAILAFLFSGTGPVAGIVMGILGNELAWKYRSFASYEEFQKVQSAWTRAGIIVVVVMVLLVPAVAVFLFTVRTVPGPVTIRH